MRVDFVAVIATWELRVYPRTAGGSMNPGIYARIEVSDGREFASP
jgi:hypothetical protein